MNYTTKKCLITFIIVLFSMSFLFPSVSSARNHTSSAASTASVPSGQYYRSQEVALHSHVQKASLYYTTDGSQPTTQSQLYKKPIHIETDTTLKVSAYKNRHRLATSTYNYRLSHERISHHLFYLLNIKECLIGCTFRKIIRGVKPIL